MNVYKVTFDEGFGSSSVIVSCDLSETKTKLEEEMLLGQALAHQHEIDITNKNFTIISWNTDHFLTDPDNFWAIEMTKLALRLGLIAVASYLFQRWLYKHVAPKHPKIMWPFHKTYQQALVEHNADYIMPSFWWGFFRPKYCNFESTPKRRFFRRLPMSDLNPEPFAKIGSMSMHKLTKESSP